MPQRRATARTTAVSTSDATNATEDVKNSELMCNPLQKLAGHRIRDANLSQKSPPEAMSVHLESDGSRTSATKIGGVKCCCRNWRGLLPWIAMPNVFVALSTYNGGDDLRPLIESIRSQSYADWTLAVRDDDSQDQTVSQIREAAAADRRIVFLEDPQRYGAAASFGVLMQHAYDAGAEYLLFADQDDVWFRDKLERMLEQMRSRETVAGWRLPHLLYSDLKVVDAELHPIHPSFLRYSRLRHGEGRPLRILLGRSFVLGCACIVNRR